MVGTFRGSFGEFEASVSDASGQPQLSGHVPVESVQVKEENLQGHLLSPEFFDIEKTPEISFQSSAIKVEDGQVVVDGELTVKGITKAVVARGEINGPIDGPDGNARLGIDLESKVIVTTASTGMDLPVGARSSATRSPVRPPRAGQGSVAMKVLAISGSLRRDPTTPRSCGGAALPPPVELEFFDGLRWAYDEDDDHGAGPPAPAAAQAIESATPC
jgi:hypothetical protein